MTRSDIDDFEIQVRQSPWAGTSTTVAENSAVAFSVGGQRLGVYVGASGVKTALDGTTVDLGADVPYPLPGGGTVTDQPSLGQEMVTWPNGGYAVVNYSGGFYLTLEVSAPYSEHGHLSGLLGNDDGRSENDIATRGGDVLPYPPTTKELYDQFSNSWRITQAESLFAYGPGQDTHTFTNLAFPYSVVSVATLPATSRAQASALCQAAGVVREPFLDDCVLDVAVTGDAGTAAASANVQTFTASTPLPTGSNLIVNPCLQAPGLSTGHDTFGSGSTEIRGWTVGADSVDVVGATSVNSTNNGWQPATGCSQSIDLAGNAPGSVSSDGQDHTWEDLPTEVGDGR